MAKIGYTRKPDGQNRVPPSTIVPRCHLIGQRPPRPDSGRITNTDPPDSVYSPPIGYPISIIPDYGRAICTLFMFLRAKNIRQLKNYNIIAPPQHDTLRCFLDVDSSGGVRSIFQKTSLISFMFCCLNSPQVRRLSCLLWLQYGCSASTDAELIISYFLDALFHGVR